MDRSFVLLKFRQIPHYKTDELQLQARRVDSETGRATLYVPVNDAEVLPSGDRDWMLCEVAATIFEGLTFRIQLVKPLRLVATEGQTVERLKFTDDGDGRLTAQKSDTVFVLDRAEKREPNNSFWDCEVTRAIFGDPNGFSDCVCVKLSRERLTRRGQRRRECKEVEASAA